VDVNWCQLMADGFRYTFMDVVQHNSPSLRSTNCSEFSINVPIRDFVCFTLAKIRASMSQSSACPAKDKLQVHGAPPRRPFRGCVISRVPDAKAKRLRGHSQTEQKV
jgi:hypothetical protein